MSRPIVANYKIFAFVLFICTALITSLFLSRIHAHPHSSIPTDMGVVFPVPRDLSPFQLIDSNQQAFTEKNLLQHWSILYFGFTQCASICPVTLASLNKIYPALQKTFPTLQIVFISVDPIRDRTDLVGQYTHKFNPDFIGLTGKINETRKFQSQLGIFSSTIANDGQLQHTTSLLVINPQGKWVGLINATQSTTQLMLAVKNILQAAESTA